MTLIKTGVKPEDARDVLPLQLKTELIMTGTESQWEQFFKLRISDHAHPDAKLSLIHILLVKIPKSFLLYYIPI